MFGSTWGQNNNQQQQQQQPQQTGGVFGQPSAFGSGGGFGSTAFGQPQQQPQQQQQQPANPMFGTPASNTAPAGFGGFGGGATTSAFGAKPATGFGAFGGSSGPSAFGGGGQTTSAFGAPAGATTTAFGQPSTSNAFGGSTLFGTKPAGTGAFGATTSTSGDASANAAPVTTGSLNPPYNVFTEKDTSGPGPSAVTLHYQSITTMPAYRGSSFEELRLQDYSQGRKTAGGFGQTAFGLGGTQQNASVFGQPSTSTGGFGGFGQTGQNNQPATGAFGGFGQPAAQTSAFGANASTTGGAFGGFGQQNQQQQQQQQQQPASTGLFGTGGAFGQANQQQQPSTSAFGGFGQNKPFGAFGNTSTATPSAFGGGAGAFGQANQQQQPATNSLFGQPQQQQQQGAASAFGGFGANAQSNALTKPSIFGAQQAQPSTGGFGLFGQAQQNQQQQQQQQQQQPVTGLFGSNSTGGGLFGQNQQQQQGQQQQQQPTGGNLFGAQPSQPTTGNLFGGGTGLFGNAGQQKPAFGSNLFGSSTNGAGGGQPQQQTNIFGQTLGQNSTQPSTTGTGAFGAGAGASSLFGNKPATTGFGQPTNQQTTGGLGTSLFGGSTLGSGGGGGLGLGTSTAIGQANGPSLTASIANPVSTNLPIFNLLPNNNNNNNYNSLSSLPNIDQQPPKKASSYFVDVPTRSPLTISSSRAGIGGNGGKLRGFGFSSTVPQSVNSHLRLGGGRTSSTLTLTGSGSILGEKNNTRSLLGPEAFLGGSNLGSDGKPSPKKLVLDKKMDPSEVFGRTGPGSGLGPAHQKGVVSATGAGVGGSKITFNPAMSVAAREKESVGLPAPAHHQTPHTSKSFLTSASKENTIPGGAQTHPQSQSQNQTQTDLQLQEGDYYVHPPLEILRNLSNNELAEFKGLIVGRKGYGEVHFLDPVNLTALPRLSSLLGKIVQIEEKECCVYPESGIGGSGGSSGGGGGSGVEGDIGGYGGDDLKPPPGEGLNVRARISLLGCWPLDKATREPIKDEKQPAFAKHLKRLKNMKHTHFEGYDFENGKWTFTVEHF